MFLHLEKIHIDILYAFLDLHTVPYEGYILCPESATGKRQRVSSCAATEGERECSHWGGGSWSALPPPGKWSPVPNSTAQGVHPQESPPTQGNVWQHGQLLVSLDRQGRSLETPAGPAAKLPE